MEISVKNSRIPLIDKAKIAIEDDILNGSLHPYERIIEEEIARKLGLSRTPVREALKQLEVKGLVTRLPTRGLIVTPITSQDIYNMFEVRENLEVLAIHLACERANEEQLNRAAQYLVQYQEELVVLERKRPQESELVYHTPLEPDANELFHLELNKASGNERLVYYIQMVRDAQRLAFVSRHFGPEDLELFMKQHDMMLEGVRSRSKEKAEKAVREHLNTVRDFFLKYLLP
jgi:DNA-binding GntR family transcriptional regulator